MKKLKYENEKLAAEHETLQKQQTDVQALSDESYRKKIKSLTGELEMFDAFAESFYNLCIVLPKVNQNSKQELTKIRSNLRDSIAYMRDICSD